MYLELREAVAKTITAVTEEHPKKAYLLVDIAQQRVEGVASELLGNLYAISDEEGLEQLFAVANRLEAEGHKVLVDSSPLVSGDAFVFPF